MRDSADLSYGRRSRCATDGVREREAAEADFRESLALAQGRGRSKIADALGMAERAFLSWLPPAQALDGWRSRMAKGWYSIEPDRCQAILRNTTQASTSGWVLRRPFVILPLRHAHSDKRPLVDMRESAVRRLLARQEDAASGCAQSTRLAEFSSDESGKGQG